LLLAWIGTKSLLAVNPDAIPRLELVRIDATVGLVTLGIALATGIVFGLAPALQLAQPELQSSLKEGTRGGSVGSGQQRLGRALVAGEVALAVVVVIGAALLVRSFWTLRNVDPGFDPSHVLAIDLSIPSARYDPNATTVFYRRLIERVGALPGVTIAAGASDLPPVSGGSNWDVEILGRPRARGTVAPSPNVRVVTADYFKTLSIALMKGRMFGRDDTGGSTPVAMINEAAAREIWPGGDPVGQQIRFSPTEPWITVVGVARDVRSTGLGAPVPDEVYLLHEQMPAITESTAQTMYVIMRTAGDPLLLATAARQAVRDLDPLIAITNIRTMTKMIDLSVAQPRFTMLLLGVFGGVALTLAVVGIYGIMAHAVKRRTREIGIRMALGAPATAIARMVVGEGLSLVAIGALAGLPLALGAGQLVAGHLAGLAPTDPVTFWSALGSFAVMGLLACCAPLVRALRISPTETLRDV
jgi:putative ABC transport system permease protein